MKSLLRYILTWLASGKENQSFIGAAWIVYLLKVSPQRFKRGLALTLLGWSPHYFFRDASEDYTRLSNRDYLEREFQRNTESREKLTELILAPYLNSGQTVLEYGCGPGFFVKAVSTRVKKVFGVDVSAGVLECARILNSRENTTFVHTTEIDSIPDGSIDLMYSMAVIQHVTDQVFESILDATWRKLTENGTVAIHVVLDEKTWATEEEWLSDTSLHGKLKLRYTLNCFTRSQDAISGLLEKHGFTSVRFQPIENLVPEAFDDICHQHLVTAQKAARPADSLAPQRAA